MIYRVTRNLNHQIWISFELFVEFTSLQKKQKEKGKGFTLILRTGREIVVGRPSGSAARVAGATSKAPRAEYAFATGEAGLIPVRLLLNGRVPPSGSLTRGAQRQVAFNLPRALRPRGGAAPAGDCWGYRASPATLYPPACSRGCDASI